MLRPWAFGKPSVMTPGQHAKCITAEGNSSSQASPCHLRETQMIVLRDRQTSLSPSSVWTRSVAWHKTASHSSGEHRAPFPAYMSQDLEALSATASRPKSVTSALYTLNHPCSNPETGHQTLPSGNLWPTINQRDGVRPARFRAITFMRIGNQELQFSDTSKLQDCCNRSCVLPRLLLLRCSEEMLQDVLVAFSSEVC